MRHTPGFYQRVLVLTLQRDAVRGGLCAILMVAPTLAGLPFWPSLILPILAYPGLWLITALTSQKSKGKKQRPTLRTEDEAYATRLDLQLEIQALSGQIEDAQASDQLRRITAWIDKILVAMAEDQKHQAAVPLLDLVCLTKDLLTAYLKVVRRGLAGAEVQERVRENLATLEAAYERFWAQLNRDTVVNLEALSETIDFNLNGLATVTERGGRW